MPANVQTNRANLDDDFPVGSASFDVVHAMMVIEHLYDPFHSFGELARTLRPGGRAFVNLPNIASVRCRLALLFGRLPHTSTPDWFARREWDGSHLHYFTVATVKQVAALVGLELIELQPVGRMTALKRLRPQLFCHEINFTLRKPEQWWPLERRSRRSNSMATFVWTPSAYLAGYDPEAELARPLTFSGNKFYGRFARLKEVVAVKLPWLDEGIRLGRSWLAESTGG